MGTDNDDRPGMTRHTAVTRRAFTLGAVAALAACSSGEEDPPASSTGTTDGDTSPATVAQPPEFTGALNPLSDGVTVPPELPHTAPTLFRGVRVFDGEVVTEAVDVILQGGVVAAVGAGLEEPQGAEVVDGAGHTLLPGMIDSHVHAYPPMQAQAARFGVLTELDMFIVDGLTSIQDEQRTTGATQRSDLLSATLMATAPGGHGTQFQPEMDTLTEASQAAGWVEDRVAEDAAYIKIVVESGFGMVPLEHDIVAALVEAAHAHSLRAIIHAQSAEDTTDALAVPLQGLAHVAWDELPPELVNRIASMGVFAVTTAGLAQPPRLKAALDDDRVMDRLDPELVSLFKAANLANDQRWAAVLSNLGALHTAGVPLLAGTDSSNPGSTSGAGLLVELSILVEAGLTPVEALTAATSLPAETFGLVDRGRIAEGLRGDVVLVEGDPTEDIHDLHKIVGVWKWGVPVELELS